MRFAIAAFTVASLAAIAGTASADTVTASYGTSYGRDINITRNANTRDIRTVQFDWTRSDTPGPGVDPIIPMSFDSYCVEIDQTVGGGQHVYEVLQPAAAGFSSFQELMFERLWGSFFADVNVDNESAAFQACVWEITYDADNMNISSDDFLVNPPSGGVVSIAQQWLDVITDAGYAGPVVNLVILHNDSVQDQITQVPTPGTAALGLLGLGAIARRRRA